MAVFSYSAMTAEGKRIKGTVDAADQKDAANRIRKLGLVPVSITAGAPASARAFVAAFAGRVRQDDLLLFYFQLRDMMDAGINLLVGIESIAAQASNERFKAALRDIGERIRKGSNFSDALEEHRDIFPPLLVSMIRSGESSGKLEAALGSYAALFEEQLDLKQKVTTALAYPAILLVMGIAVIVFLVTFIIPKFVTIFADAGVELPLPTMLLDLTAKTIIRYWYLLIAAVFLAAVAFRRWLRTPSGRAAWDAFALRMPVIGALNRNVALSRFATTLGILLKSGVPMMKSLALTGAVMQNVVMEGAVEGLGRGVEKGESLSAMMRQGGAFPPDLIQMVAVGEETGNLDGMLAKAGTFYAKAISNAIKKMTVVIEPLFLIVIGGAVGFIMASILLPLFSLINAVQM